MVTQVGPEGGGNADIEAWLTERGVAWEFDPALDLARIDKAESVANQARLEPVVEEVVERYAADYERGDRFPPLVVNRKGRGKVVLIGGNHRAAGAGRAGKTHHPAYLVEVAGPEALRLAYEDNRRHGLPPGTDERVLQALHLVDSGLTQGEAARVVGLSIQKVNRGVVTAKGDRRARELGMAEWPGLSSSTRWRLSSIVDPPVFVAAIRVVARTGMNQTEVSNLVTRIMAIASTKDALQFIGDEEASRAALSGRSESVRSTSPRAKMLDALRVIAGLDADDIVAGCVSIDHRSVLSDRLMAAARTMQGVQRLLSS